MRCTVTHIRGGGQGRDAFVYTEGDHPCSHESVRVVHVIDDDQLDGLVAAICRECDKVASSEASRVDLFDAIRGVVADGGWVSPFR